jgi:mRNA interferase RelE/StbE
VAGYSVIITKAATKEIDAIASRIDRQRIEHRVHQLAANPRPPGSKKMKGADERYRVRQGDYRILYSIEDEIRVVAIIHVAHRKDVYRRRGRA